MSRLNIIIIKKLMNEVDSLSTSAKTGPSSSSEPTKADASKVEMAESLYHNAARCYPFLLYILILRIYIIFTRTHYLAWLGHLRIMVYGWWSTVPRTGCNKPVRIKYTSGSAGKARWPRRSSGNSAIIYILSIIIVFHSCCHKLTCSCHQIKQGGENITSAVGSLQKKIEMLDSTQLEVLDRKLAMLTSDMENIISNSDKLTIHPQQEKKVCVLSCCARLRSHHLTLHISTR